MKTISLNNFITNQVAVMQQILPHHQLSLELIGDVTINSDELRLEQVFSNLLGNAAKYSERNTMIRISTSLTEGGKVTVAVIDQGKGISPESLKSIFNKFYRAKDVLKTHAGLGMGLYVTSKIVTDHGGTIWAESTEGTGSAFYFTLPLASGGADE
jgi:signal transduction histidine kinase